MQPSLYRFQLEIECQIQSFHVLYALIQYDISEYNNLEKISVMTKIFS